MVTWGAWDYGGGNGMRIGYNIFRTAVDHNSDSVTFTVDIFTQNQWAYADNDQWIDYTGGELSGRTYYNNHSGSYSSQPAPAVYRDTKTYTYYYGDNYGGSGDNNKYAYATVGYTYNGVHPSVTIHFAIPIRPYAPPNYPGDLWVVDYTNEWTDIRWVNNPTTGRPYDSITVQVDYVDALGNRYGYETRATLGGGATAWRDNGVAPDSRVYYRIRANNSAGSSGWRYLAEGPYPTNEPNQPSDVSASVDTSGQSVTVTWTNNHRLALFDGADPTGHEIQREDANGVWTTVASLDNSRLTSWTDESPNDGYNRYRVNTSVLNYYGYTFRSPWVESNTISTIVPPLAPTSLSPDGAYLDLNNEITLSWTYHDGGDGANQSHYEIRVRENGTTNTWDTIGPFASNAKEHALTPQSYPNGKTWEWQVRTQGSTTVGYGPWSGSALIHGSTTPLVSIRSDAPPESLEELPVNLWWNYSQVEGVAQTKWEAELRDSEGRLLESQEQSGTFTEETETEDIYPVRGLMQGSNTDIFLNTEAGASGGNATLVSGDGPNGENVVVFNPVDNSTLYGPELQPTAYPTEFVEGDSITFSVDWWWDSSNTSTNAILEIQAQSDGTNWNNVVLDSFAISDFAKAGWQTSQIVASVPSGISAASIHPVITTPQSGETFKMTNLSMFRERTGYTMTFTEPVEDTKTYTVKIRARSGDGLWSDWDSASFTVNLLPPAPTTFQVAFDDPSGTMVLTVESSAATPDIDATVDHVTIQRRIDSSEGDPWQTIIEDLSLSAGQPVNVLDLIPTLYGRNEYRLIVTSVSPSQRVTEPVEEFVENYKQGNWFFLNYGSAFTKALRFNSHPSVSVTPTRSGNTVGLLGRKWPILQQGRQQSRTIEVGGRLVYVGNQTMDSSPAEWEEALLNAETVCYRDPSGRRVFGWLSELSTSDVRWGVADLSFTVVQTDYSETANTIEEVQQ